jgi:hypothetical protein
MCNENIQGLQEGYFVYDRQQDMTSILQGGPNIIRSKFSFGLLEDMKSKIYILLQC